MQWTRVCRARFVLVASFTGEKRKERFQWRWGFQNPFKTCSIHGYGCVLGDSSFLDSANCLWNTTWCWFKTNLLHLPQLILPGTVVRYLCFKSGKYYGSLCFRVQETPAGAVGLHAGGSSSKPGRVRPSRAPHFLQLILRRNLSVEPLVRWVYKLVVKGQLLNKSFIAFLKVTIGKQNPLILLTLLYSFYEI